MVPSKKSSGLHWRDAPTVVLLVSSPETYHLEAAKVELTYLLRETIHVIVMRLLHVML